MIRHLLRRFLASNKAAKKTPSSIWRVEPLERRWMLADSAEAEPVQVADINSDGSSSPSSLVNVNGTLFFSASDNTYFGPYGFIDDNQELWKSDGTAEGTVLVKEIQPGDTSGSHPSSLVNVDGTLFFSAIGVSGRELWKSDGTPEGTVPVADINPDGSSSPSSLVNVNGTLFFSASDSTYFGPYGFIDDNQELWKSDGTAEGTVLVKEIQPGDTSGSHPSSLVNVDGTLFFSAIGVSGRELWKSDGTPEGTVPVADINSDGSSSPSSLVNVNGTLFFSASDNTYFGPYGFIDDNQELWKSDGTAEGTVLVKEIQPGDTSGSHPSSLVNVDGTLFFSAIGVSGRELWKSDGTPEGTVPVADINPDGSSSPSSLVNVNGTLFFSASDNTYFGPYGFIDDNQELWKSDGTAEGTVLVKEIQPGDTSGSHPSSLVNVDGTLFFSAIGVSGRELWKLPSGPDIGATFFGWHTDSSDGGGVDVKYEIKNLDIPPGVVAQLYWANGPELENILSNASPFIPLEEREVGEWDLRVTAQELGMPPDGTTHLLLRLDVPLQGDGEDGAVEEPDEENNLKPFVLDASNIVGPVINKDEQEIESVVVNVAGPKIEAEFKPAGGALTIGQAAKLLKVDHFNWIQEIDGTPDHWEWYVVDANDPNQQPSVSGDAATVRNGAQLPDPSLSNPLTDPINPSSFPINGSLLYGVASEIAEGEVWVPVLPPPDNANFYLNEPIGPVPFFDPLGQESDFSLKFSDTPRLGRRWLQTGESVTFNTRLAGVDPGLEPTTWDGLKTHFFWSSNSLIAEDLLRLAVLDSDGPPIISGGVFEVGIDDETPNQVPVLDEIGDRNFDVGTAISIPVTANDADNDDQLTFSLDSALVGATIDPVTGQFRWTPDRPQTTEVTVRVTDNGSPSLSSTQTFTIGVFGATDRIGVLAVFGGGDVVSRFGTTTDTPLSGDFNGDGNDDLGVHRFLAENGVVQSRFLLDTNDDGKYEPGVDARFTFGADGDVPLVGDWNNSGTDTIGVKRGNRFLLDINGDGVFADPPDVIFTFDAPNIGNATPVIGDWNGDGSDDLGAHFGDTFYLDLNGNGVWDGNGGGDAEFILGQAGDIPIAGDWDGDGTDEVGLHRGREFLLDLNGDHSLTVADITIFFGNAAGDEAVIGDWNGDGTDDIGVHRRQLFLTDANGSRNWEGTGNNTFQLDSDGNGLFGGGDTNLVFGVNGDIPVAGDFNGDGVDDIGVRRGRKFLLDANGNKDWDSNDGGDRVFNFGLEGDTPLIGDWSGDGLDTVGVHRNNLFLLDVDGDGVFDPDSADQRIQFGNPGDLPVVGDWNGDGVDEIGVYRGNEFFLDIDGDGTFSLEFDARFQFGQSGDRPLIGDWNGNGVDAVGVFRGNEFILDVNGDRLLDIDNGDVQFQFGTANNQPLIGRWNEPSLRPDDDETPNVAARSTAAVTGSQEAVLFTRPVQEKSSDLLVAEGESSGLGWLEDVGDDPSAEQSDAKPVQESHLTIEQVNSLHVSKEEIDKEVDEELIQDF